MISPELLRRYPIFTPYNENQMREIAMISEELIVGAGAILFEECNPADSLYLLLEGSVDLFYTSVKQDFPDRSKEFLVGEINPGELLGISALIEPFELSATARTSQPSRLVKIKARELRKILEKDTAMGYGFMCQIAKIVLERLAYTRIQLAAAWA